MKVFFDNKLNDFCLDALSFFGFQVLFAESFDLIWVKELKYFCFSEAALFIAWKVSEYGVLSSPYFPVFGLNTEIYRENLRIQFEYRKIRTRKNSVFGHFHAVFDYFYFQDILWNSYQLLLLPLIGDQCLIMRFHLYYFITSMF